jgi:maleylpyruvate isomerase
MRVDRPHVTGVGDDIAHLVAVHRRLEAAVHGLDDGDMRSSSRLRGWSMGHLLTHLARNADSVRRRAEGAMRGAIVDQYHEGRGAEIAAGAGRPSAALLDDVATSNARLELVLARVPADAWAHLTRDVGGTERPLYELPCRRWYEVEVHLVDFGDPVGLTHDALARRVRRAPPAGDARPCAAAAGSGLAELTRGAGLALRPSAARRPPSGRAVGRLSDGTRRLAVSTTASLPARTGQRYGSSPEEGPARRWTAGIPLEGRRRATPPACTRRRAARAARSHGRT